MSRSPAVGSLPAELIHSLDDVRVRCAALLHAVPGAERQDAERVLALTVARGLDADATARRRELLGLIERLGRRSGVAVPFASLARALSAVTGARPAIAVAREALALADEALSFRGY